MGIFAASGAFTSLNKIQKLQKTMSIAVGIATIVIGILGGIAILISFNFLSTILCWYLAIFGFITVLGEMNIALVLKKFQFMETYFGRSIFYLFVGTLGITFNRAGNSIIIFISGCIMLASGFISFLMFVFRQKTGLELKKAQQAAKAQG